ncbi:MAG: hypothetical protein AABM67_19160 [Acidobacteriota bacterium]
MDKIDEPKCARVDMKISLWFATPGAVAFLGFVLFKLIDVLFEQQERQRQYLGRNILYYAVLGLVIVGTLYLSAAVLGRQAGKFFCRKPPASFRAALIGILVALGCLASGVVMWSIFNLIEVSLFAADLKLSDILFFSSLVGVVAFIYGFIPAILLGVLFGQLLKRRLAQAEWKKA